MKKTKMQNNVNRYDVNKKIYFIYLINEMDKLKYDYKQMKLQNLLYFSAALSKSRGLELFNELEFHSSEYGPLIQSERDEIVNNFFTCPRKYAEYYYDIIKEKELNKINKMEKEIINEIIILMGPLSSVCLTVIIEKDIFRDVSTPFKNTKYGEIININEMGAFYNEVWFNSFKKNLIEIKATIDKWGCYSYNKINEIRRYK